MSLTEIILLALALAILLGHRMGKKAGKPMEIFGGLLLIAIGIKILLTHLMA